MLGRGETCIVYRCLIILRNVFGSPGAKDGPRGPANTKCFSFFFFLLYTTPKSTIKLISIFFYDLYNIYPFSEGRRILHFACVRTRLSVCMFVCMYVRMYVCVCVRAGNGM